MRSAVIGFVVGVGWLQMQAVLPSYSVLFLLIAAAVVLAWWLRKVRHPAAAR